MVNNQYILLIEPDIVLAKIYVQVLTSVGLAVHRVTNAQDAIIKANDNCPNLIICELQLVSHGGIEFLYEFRSYRDWQQVPIIILSNIPPLEFASSQRILFKELGIARYLYKNNTTNKELLDAVSQVLMSSINETT